MPAPESVVSRRADARLAVDIGGTFTDVVIERGGKYRTAKVLTTHDAPERGAIEGIGVALKVAELRPGDIGIIIHGTTLATNALIERKGARTALLTTAGFRDTIELGTESRFDQYDINLVKQPPIIPRNLRIPIVERIAANGDVLRDIDEESVKGAILKLRAESIESVAIAFLHSYVQPRHEQRVRDCVRAALPDIAISLSSEVSPEMREYERFTTTCANAYVQPLVAGYLTRLEQDLKAGGFICPLYLMLSSGGITTVETARAFPIRLVESGPAGGAIFARNVAARHGARNALSFDMGGTTAKICLIDDFKPQAARVFEVDRSSRFLKGSGLPVRIPVIEMVEIGAGGSSIARIDHLRRIAVGPESAGSMPGPACYGRGGTEPTVTDADLTLGRIDPDAFAGGRVTLYPDRSETAMSREGAALNLGAKEFAYAIVELVDEAMANAARVHTVEHGKTLSDRTLIAFGGAAPLHVGRVAEKLGISRVIVPTGAGVGSAVGFLQAPISYEVARSLYVKVSDFQPGPVNQLLSAMIDEARAVALQGAQGQPLTEGRTAYARYVGQGHELRITLPIRELCDNDAAMLRAAFESAYLEQYGRLIEGVDIEILAWTVRVGTDAMAPLMVAPVASRRTLCTSKNRRDSFDINENTPIKTAVFRRSELAPGDTFAGPAIITEDSTSTIIGRGYDVEIASDGSIIMTHRK